MSNMTHLFPELYKVFTVLCIWFLPPVFQDTAIYSVEPHEIANIQQFLTYKNGNFIQIIFSMKAIC